MHEMDFSQSPLCPMTHKPCPHPEVCGLMATCKPEGIADSEGVTQLAVIVFWTVVFGLIVR
jgi:hypothetical protein